MHELSLATEINEIVRKQVGDVKVKSVEVVIGALSGVAFDELDFCMKMVFEDAFGKGVRIFSRIKEAEALCSCGAEYP
jgi:Zn finger protein HypA/HybF involved in hydrogenase expression